MRRTWGFFTSECIVDVFLSFCLIISGKDTALGHQAKLFVCVLSVENKINTFQLAAPPYQVLDELKVWLSWSPCHQCWIILWRQTQTIMPLASCYLSMSVLTRVISRAIIYSYAFYLWHGFLIALSSGHTQVVSIWFTGRHWTQLRELGESYDCCELFTHSNQG